MGPARVLALDSSLHTIPNETAGWGTTRSRLFESLHTAWLVAVVATLIHLTKSKHRCKLVPLRCAKEQRVFTDNGYSNWVHGKKQGRRASSWRCLYQLVVVIARWSSVKHVCVWIFHRAVDFKVCKQREERLPRFRSMDQCGACSVWHCSGACRHLTDCFSLLLNPGRRTRPCLVQWFLSVKSERLALPGEGRGSCSVGGWGGYRERESENKEGSERDGKTGLVEGEGGGRKERMAEIMQ